MKKLLSAIVLLCLTLTATAQDINKKDAGGQRHGLWKGVYEDTKLPRYEGTFNHGKETGVFKFFENTKGSPVVATKDFSAGNGSCYTVFFDAKGAKTAEGREVNKVREGEWKFYQEGGALLSLENYTGGKLTGTKKVFYPGTILAEETVYVNGVKEGPYRRYTEKGVVIEEAQYKNDEFHGPVIYRNPGNQVIVKGQFKNGKKAGIWQYFEKGKLVKEVDMSAKRVPAKKAN
ncbi:hypothetical protein CHU92_14330 [Flavobacterium cyanobacteriorum]|uniref:Preprotein translocase YidC n=1 Tax=Flavobacterium cyanobacteriorum TaxID=2022802 RepID=A0A255YSV4_9FLAO|nr:hypothetical protein [Flavobacterium cyanobacteriorum]OYQ32259.1 hypothetical protein CHU92_14330 [Flavobacterium cyanobacteriorum]